MKSEPVLTSCLLFGLFEDLPDVTGINPYLDILYPSGYLVPLLFPVDEGAPHPPPCLTVVGAGTRNDEHQLPTHELKEQNKTLPYRRIIRTYKQTSRKQEASGESLM